MTIETLNWDGVDLPFFIGIDELDLIMGDDYEAFSEKFRIKNMKRIVWGGIRGGCIETGAKCDLIDIENYNENEVRGLVNRNPANFRKVMDYWTEQGALFSGDENVESAEEKKPLSTGRKSKGSASGTGSSRGNTKG